MAQNNATVMVEGNVVKSERKNGSFTDNDDPSRVVSYDFVEARLVTPEFDAIDVRFPSDGSIPLPERDELVCLVCDARPSGRNLKLTVQRVLPARTPVAAH